MAGFRIFCSETEPDASRQHRYYRALTRGPRAARPGGHLVPVFASLIPRTPDAPPRDGVETIRWLSVIEEVRVDPNDPTTGSFSLAIPSVGSFAGVRLYHQAASIDGGATGGFAVSNGIASVIGSF